MRLEKVAIKNDRQGDMRIGLRIGRPMSDGEQQLPVPADEDQ